MGGENLAPNGIQSPDRPARSESLSRRSYSVQYNRKEFNMKLPEDGTGPRLCVISGSSVTDFAILGALNKISKVCNKAWR